jgi:hypothetical protein
VSDSFVHGRLPYDNIKPDPVLKHILKNMRIRKLVRSLPEIKMKDSHVCFSELTANELLTHVFQIFTNGDMIHAVKALQRLGLEDCFEGIICFETLNPPCLLPSCDQDEPEIFDIAGHFARSGGVDELPRTPVLCKPNVDAMEAALRIANVNPYKAVCTDSFSSHKLQHFGFVLDRALTKTDLLAADFLRRQRAQHSGWQSNRSPHSAGKPAVDVHTLLNFCGACAPSTLEMANSPVLRRLARRTG